MNMHRGSPGTISFKSAWEELRRLGQKVDRRRATNIASAHPHWRDAGASLRSTIIRRSDVGIGELGH
jgi:hypothetical protein